MKEWPWKVAGVCCTALFGMLVLQGNFSVQAAPHLAETTPVFFIRMPAVYYQVPTNTPTPSPIPTGEIIIDHHHTDVHAIPDAWITAAKAYVIHYAHTSHGNQVLSGLQWLESRDAKYNVSIDSNGTVVLPPDATAMRIYDGNNYSGTTYITPDLYWESADGRAHTQQVLNTGWFDITLWTWCGQASYYTTTQIDLYLNTMLAYETANPGVRAILYTGHTDGSAPGSDLWRNNDRIRQFARDHDMVLFDFADIETYSPAGGGPFYNDGEGNCAAGEAWCTSWCTAYPTSFECQSLPSCDHTNGLACTLKGQAFWWLLARMAGWDGA